jgi:hypothetical protein
MNTKQLLNEWRNYLNSLNNPKLLNEISLRAFTAEFPEFDTSSFSPQLKGNTIYLDIIANTIRSGTEHSVEDYKSQFEYFKTTLWNSRNTWSDDFKSKFDFENNTSTATYEDIQLYRQGRAAVGKGSKKEKQNIYQQILDNKDPEKYQTIHEDSNWIICYPNSTLGSISLARSYWNGTKLEYDMTFNVSTGIGEKTGKMNWCTSVDGSGNKFNNYHNSNEMLHMYYCIKKSTNASDNNRKLCISFIKDNNQATLKVNDSSTVDGNNNNITQSNIMSILGSNNYEIIRNDVLENRQNLTGLYENYTLEMYKEERQKATNEDSLSSLAFKIQKILEDSIEKEKISDFVFEHETNVNFLFQVAFNVNPEKINFRVFNIIKDKISVKDEMAQENRYDLLEEIIKKSPDKHKIFDYYLLESQDLDLVNYILLKFCKKFLNKDRIEIAINRNMLKFITLIKILDIKYAEDNTRLYDYFEDKYRPLISKFPK